MALKIHNWDDLLDEFTIESRLNTSTLKSFAQRKKVNYSLMSQEFVKLRKERAAKYYETAQYKFAEGSVKAAHKMVDLIDADDGNLALKASVAVAGIAGHSPAVAQLNVTQAVQTNIEVASFFPAATDDLKSLLTGGKVVDAEVEE